ncbi:MAG: ABC transporter ATP-binding protein [Deltaproteobacteria bacterium]|nr:MAG: ABC transporter ATP-binding protein [Deltaproteobacteria bacterium]
MIRVEGLTKRFGRAVALAGVDFDARAGEVVGLVGPNGAGKTTTLRILAGFLSPDGGSAWIGDIDVARDRERAVRKLAYLPESAPLYDDMRVDQFLRFRAQIKGIERARRARCIDEALDAAGVADRRTARIATLSKGYRQRVALADALLGAPPVLLLDEPTTGLDPLQVRQFRRLVADLAGRHTVLLSSHRLDDVQALASRVVVMSRGRVVADAPPDALAAGGSLEDAVVERLS